MNLYFTTTTGPPWLFGGFVDTAGNVIPGFQSATFTLTLRSVSTGQKVRGNGTFGGATSSGQVTYFLSSTDLATAYAAFSTLPGVETFEVFVEAVISSLVYDAMPVQIQIRKI